MPTTAAGTARGRRRSSPTSSSTSAKRGGSWDEEVYCSLASDGGTFRDFDGPRLRWPERGVAPMIHATLVLLLANAAPAQLPAEWHPDLRTVELDGPLWE